MGEKQGGSYEVKGDTVIRHEAPTASHPDGDRARTADAVAVAEKAKVPAASKTSRKTAGKAPAQQE